MHKKQFDIREIEEGAYYPGVFIIKLKKILKENIQYDDFDDEDWRTLMHEYIHFLQDISTTTGYMYFLHKSQLLNAVMYYINNKSSGDIILPIRLGETGIENIEEKDNLLNFYNGDYEHIKIHHVNCIKYELDDISTEIICGDSMNDKLESVNIYYDDKATPYVFGRDCIVESMAYLVERHLWEGEERINELPYNACEIICRSNCPELLNSPKKILMLAEVAIMHENPGMVFWEAILYCSKEKMFDKSDDYFRDFCLSNIDTVQQKYDELFHAATNGIDVLFPKVFPYTTMTNEKLKMFLECGHNLRMNQKLFISDFFDKSNLKDYMKWMISITGAPMLIDGNEDYFGEEETQNIPVADAVLDVLIGDSDSGCGLQLYCKRSGMLCYDKNKCTNAPWKQSKSNATCPLAMYFMGYNIECKKYKWRE